MEKWINKWQSNCELFESKQFDELSKEQLEGLMRQFLSDLFIINLELKLERLTPAE